MTRVTIKRAGWRVTMVKTVEWRVTMAKAGMVSTYGTYPTKEEAKYIAHMHRVTGYWDTVDVLAILTDN